MKSFHLVALACAGLLGFGTRADPGEVYPKYEGNATAIDCLNPFNEARAAAGLPAFVSAGTEFRVQNAATDFAKNVCQALMTHESSVTIPGFNKTIALAVQDGAEGDCAAAVTHFNGALSLFGDLPPAFSTSSDSVYKQLQAVSFVALYNPKENPKLDCGYFTCTKSETTTTTQAPKQPIQSSESNGLSRVSASDPQVVTTTFKGLLCATDPQALIEGQEPFQQKQFNKIKAAINLASSATPALVTLMVGAAGLLLL